MSHAALRTQVSRRRLEQAVVGGELTRVRRGVYALPETDSDLRLAGTLILASAARALGLAVLHTPLRPQVAIARGRHLPPTARRSAAIRWWDLPRGDRWGLVTTPLRTVRDCAAFLPFDQALAIADEALRNSLVDEPDLRGLAESVHRRFRARVDRVARAADRGAANPFESALRSICLSVPGLDVVTQAVISDSAGVIGRVDLAAPSLRLVIEAESLEFHGGRASFERDCLRYNRLVAQGWTVLRFPWGQVIHHQDLVRQQLIDSVALLEWRRGRSGGPRRS